MVVGLETQEKLQRQYLKQMADKAGLVVCTCGNIFELLEGTVSHCQKDNSGKTLSKAAAAHMGKCRVRCNGCGRNFCSKCLEYPYHLGYTCEGYRSYKNSAKCRYCKAEVSGNSGVDVCSRKDCAAAFKNACKAILPCGHRCYGSFSLSNRLFGRNSMSPVSSIRLRKEKSGKDFGPK